MKKFHSITSFFTIVILAGFSGWVSGQSPQPMNDPSIVVGPIVEIPLAGTIVLGDQPEDFNAILKNERVIHEPGTNPSKEAWQKLKDEANRQKELAKRNPPAQKQSDVKLTVAPDIGTQFFGNTFDGGIPNDNGLSISAAGKIVSVTNSRIHTYSATGTQLNAKSLSSFSSGVSGVGSNTKYDPKTVYDPIADRFIVVYLNGSSSSTSKIVVAFSKTNDPSGAWNIYGLNGNVTGSVWSDFVQIGISTSELFITSNLFTNSNVSNGNAIYEIELADGYAGTSLTSRNFSGNYFSLNPVSGGSTMYGPHFYLLGTDQGSSSTVFVHKVTNSIANGGVLESPVAIQLSTGYSQPPDADQVSSTNLSTGDTRIQSSFLENGRIEFVLGTSHLGQPEVFHGTVIISPLSLSFSSGVGQVIHYPDIHIGFPAIAYGGIVGGDGTNTCFIMFNFCSSTRFPGCAATYIDTDGLFSEYAVLKVGNGSVSGGGTPARWGDYADIQERPGTPGEAWVGGSFATSNGYTGTYISQITTPAMVALSSTISDEPQKLEAYPVPANQFLNFSFPVSAPGNFELEIIDMNGKVLARPVSDYLKPGTAKVAFNPQVLPDGVYTAIVKGENGELLRKKFTVTK